MIKRMDMDFQKNCYDDVKFCPWCGGTKYRVLFEQKETGDVRSCQECGLVYSSIKLNKEGLNQYWVDYESNIHVKNEDIEKKRRIMYGIEYNFIKPFIKKKGKVLDVGCSDGSFLDFFAKDGFKCEGTEYGSEAYKLASKKYKTYFGNLTDINIDGKYDLIILRGVIQFLIEPQECIKKIISLLSKEGVIFITSSPNSDSLCFRLFKENFTLPVNASDYCMYNEKIITTYMNDNGMDLLVSTHFYLNTPYENIEEDVLKVADAIEKNKQGLKVQGKSPAFFDNMLTLIYKRSNG